MFQDLITEIMGMVGKFEHAHQTSKKKKKNGLQKCQGTGFYVKNMQLVLVQRLALIPQKVHILKASEWNSGTVQVRLNC